MIQSSDVLKFWFQDLNPKDHFQRGKELDIRIREIIVLDQFSRNMFRGLPESFIPDAR